MTIDDFESEELDETPAPEAEADAWEMDPALQAALIRTESGPNGGNPNAVSNKNARGLMQVTDIAVRDLGLDPATTDVFDPETNKALGTAYYKKQLDRFGDEKLALAAYNGGPTYVSNMLKKHGADSFEEIAADLYPETRNYVKNITERKEAYKADPNSTTSQVYAKAPEGAAAAKLYPQTEKGFADALTPIISDPSFDTLPFKDKQQKVLGLYNSQNWGGQTYDVVKNIMSGYWDAAAPDELPDLEAIVSPPPVLESGDEAKNVLDAWKEEQVINLYNKGISPAIFGDALDKYLDSAASAEQKAHTSRNRGIFENVLGFGLQAPAYNLAVGAVAGVAKPIAGITRLAGGIDAANAIESVSDYIPKPADDLIYQTDETGHLLTNPDGTPVTRWATDAAQIVGQVGTLFAGGAALKGLGYSAQAINYGFLGVNTFTVANDSFKTVYEETGGDTAKAYKGAALSLPAAAIGSLGQTAVLAKWANPAISALSPFNKGLYLANVFARNAGIESVANAGMDLTAQVGETLQTGNPISGQRLAQNAVAGGLIGGAVGAFGAAGDRPRAAPVAEAMADTDVAPPAQPPPGQLALPPGAEPPPLLAGPNRKALPGNNNPLLSGPLYGPNESAVFAYAPTSVDDQIAITKRLDSFQKSTDTTLVITSDQARNLPPEMLTVMDLQPASDGQTFSVTKRESYVQKDATTLPDAQKNVLSVSDSLIESPSPDSVNSLIEERATVKAEIARRAKGSDQALVQALKTRNELQKNLDARKSEYESQTDRTLKGVSRLEVQEAEAALGEFDSANEAVYGLHERVGELQGYLETLNEKLKVVMDPLYVNNIKAKERNLKNLLEIRSKFEADAAARMQSQETVNLEAQARQQDLENFSKGVEVEGSRILPINDKWYVTDSNGDVVGGPHSFFYDAVNTAKTKGNPERGFQLRNLRDKTSLTEADVQDIRSNLARERADAEAKARQDAAVKKESDELGREHNEEVYKEEVRQAKAKTSKEDAARKKTLIKEGKISTEPKSEVTAFAEEDPSIQGFSTQNAEGEIPAKASEPQEPLKGVKPTTYRNLTRRPLSTAQKPVSSNYTKTIQFPENSSEVIRPKQIFNDLQKVASKISGTKIFVGGSMPAQTLGFRHLIQNFIKVGDHNDIQTAQHELMHAIDAELIGKYEGKGTPGDYSALPPNVVEAAKDMAETYYPRASALKTEDLKVKEGMAMFLQHYMSGQPVRQEMKSWFESSFAKENPQVFKALQEIKDLTFKYYNQDTFAFKKSEIVPKPTPTQKFIQDVHDYTRMSNMQDEWVDKDQVFKDADKVTGGKGKLKDTIDVYRNLGPAITKSLLNDGIASVNGRIYETPAVSEILKDVNTQEDLDLLNSYLTSKRELPYLEAGMDTGSNIKSTQDFIRKIEATKPNIVAAADGYYKLLDVVDQIGLDLSPASAATTKALMQKNLLATNKTNGFYIPFSREGKASFNPGKPLKGSSRAKVDPISNIESAISTRLNRMFEGEVKRKLVELAGDDAPSSLGAYVREIRKDNSKHAEVAKKFEKQVRDSTDNKEPSKDDRMVSSFFGDPLDGISSTEFKVLPIFDGNKMRFFEVNPRVARAFNDELPAIVNHPIWKFLRAGASTLRPMATTLNYAFQLRQLIKDPVDAWQYIKTGNGGFRDALSLGQAVISQLKDVALHGDINKWAERTGAKWGSRGGAIEAERAQLKKEFGNNVLNGTNTTYRTLRNYLDIPLELADRALSVPEQAVRQAAVKVTAKQLGITDINAPMTAEQSMALILAYKRSTTNFGQQGRSARVVNQLVPFFTARIAGLSRLPSDVKRNAGRMVGLGGVMLSAGILHAIAHKDDQWYQEMDPEQRMNNVWESVNVNGQNKAIKLPLNSFTSLTWGLGQAIGAKMTEDPNMPLSYGELAKAYFSQNVSPMTSTVDITSPLVKEYIQQTANKDFYFDKPIVYPSLQYADPRNQYTEYTTEFAKRMGNLTGWSPIRIDHAIRSIAPAASNGLTQADRLLGLKDDKETTSTNFLIEAFSRAGTTEGIQDRSRRAMTDLLMAARANKYAETPEEGYARKQLEKINRNVSDINTMLSVTKDSKDRSELRKLNREQIRNGIKIATRGEGVAVSTGLEEIAKDTRKGAATRRGLEMKQRRAEIADSLANTTAEETKDSSDSE